MSKRQRTGNNSPRQTSFKNLIKYERELLEIGRASPNQVDILIFVTNKDFFKFNHLKKAERAKNFYNGSFNPKVRAKANREYNRLIMLANMEREKLNKLASIIINKGERNIIKNFLNNQNKLRNNSARNQFIHYLRTQNTIFS